MMRTWLWTKNVAKERCPIWKFEEP